MSLLDSAIQSVTSMISPSTLGTQLGESPEAVKQGVETGTTAILGGLANKAGDSGFMSKIFGMVTGGGAGAPAEAGAPAAPAGGLASSFLSSIFGNQQSSITDTIGRLTGLKSGSATGLMAALAPAVLGFLGHHIKSNGLSASGFSNMLKAEAPSISRALPPGLNLPSPDIKGAASQVAHKSKWLWPVLAACAALLLAIILWPRHREAQVAKEPPARPAVPAMPAVTDMVTRKLPGGVEVSIPRSGVESGLLSSLETGNIDANKWFTLDRLQFAGDSADLQPASRAQLMVLARILNAYPNVRVRVGGFTDNAGDAARNLDLSGQRAEAVKAELVKQGVSADRIEAKGYGQENPVADNSTETGRQQNRRVAIELIPQ